MLPLIHVLGESIGLAREYYAHQKASRLRQSEGAKAVDTIDVEENAPSSSTSITPSSTRENRRSSISKEGPYPASLSSEREAPPPYSRYDLDEEETSENENQDDDDVEWLRDEAAAELNPSQEETEANEPPQTVEEFTEEFSQRHPLPAYIHPPDARLPCAVIIPQKRPTSRSRGFVRAYAPVLADVGIDQDTFMDFHHGFQNTINKQSSFTVINLAAIVLTLVDLMTRAPGTIVPAATFAVHTSLKATQEAASSKRINNYLDQMNEKLFKPHGLYGLIMKYNPRDHRLFQHGSSSLFSQIILNDKQKGRALFASSLGKTGEEFLPEAAPLIYPSLEYASDEQKVGVFKKIYDFHSDYRDRYSQAKFARLNPDSQFTSAYDNVYFASRYSDPNHPAREGSMIALLTGGAIAPKTAMRRLRGKNRATPFHKSAANTPEPTEGESKTETRKSYKSPGSNTKWDRRDLLQRRTLRENVIYLMILNMPTTEELHQVDEMKKKLVDPTT